MLFRAVLVDATHAAFEDRIEALDRVCVDVAAHIGRDRSRGQGNGRCVEQRTRARGRPTQSRELTYAFHSDVTMNHKPEVFQNQFPIVKWFVYHLTYYRALSNGYKEHQLQNEFWTLTIDAHLLRAAINWCMVFGSDKSNPTHWNQNFREGLFKATGLNQNTWQQYWKSMTYFRNKYAAHRELPFTSPVPVFDTALAVAYYYDNWVRKIISPATFEEPTLESFALSLQKSLMRTNSASVSSRSV